MGFMDMAATLNQTPLRSAFGLDSTLYSKATNRKGPHTQVPLFWEVCGLGARGRVKSFCILWPLCVN